MTLDRGSGGQEDMFDGGNIKHTCIFIYEEKYVLENAIYEGNINDCIGESNVKKKWPKPLKVAVSILIIKSLLPHEYKVDYA